MPLKNIAFSAAAGLAMLLPLNAGMAALPEGADAPNVVTQGAVAGEEFTFDLSEALKQGPVVLYFYPKAFTKGCTLEANAFSEAMDDFHAAGAQVVGLSADDIATLKRFSTEECRDAFPVAIASDKTIADYDVALRDTGLSNRTSYVIAPDGKIVMVHSKADWREHVAKSLAAVQALKN